MFHNLCICSRELEAGKEIKTHQWTHHFSPSFYLSSSLASTPCFTHGWVWQVVFRSNDTLLLAGSSRTNTHVHRWKPSLYATSFSSQCILWKAGMKVDFNICPQCHKKWHLLILRENLNMQLRCKYHSIGSMHPDEHTYYVLLLQWRQQTTGGDRDQNVF